MRPRKRKSYFETGAGAPAPVVAEVCRRVHFSEADPMGIVWYGRYSLFLKRHQKSLAGYADLHIRISTRQGFALR